MTPELKVFMASLHYAVWTRQRVVIAGGEFSHEELTKIVENLEALIDKE